MNFNYGYARVSTDDQNLATQLDTLDKAGCHKIYQEKITGMSTSRPQLDKLLEILRPGDTVTVARFNRLGRNSAHLVALLKEFEEKQIHFVALDLGIDSSTPAGQLVMHVFAALAEYQRRELLEKTAHGRQLAQAAGVHMGRPKGADPVQLAKVKAGLEAKMSVKQIVAMTGISLATVKRYRSQLEISNG
ncbi:MAG: recombinase family protein [Janthinobacterium lividum]